MPNKLIKKKDLLLYSDKNDKLHFVEKLKQKMKLKQKQKL